MDLGYLILQVLVFPGLLFTAVAGLITSWVDRKVTARVQMRVGPPFLQPFYDVLKLMIKETCIPAGTARGLFLSAPLFGMAAAALASLLIWRAFLVPGQTFSGDIIVILYLLTIPAVSVILGSFASQNPLASLGGSREMKLLLAYELPFVLAILVPVIHTHSIRLFDLLAAAPAVYKPSGIIAFAVAIICMQAKLTLVPFDAPEAETELTGGAYVEYSGPPLGVFKLTRAMMLFTMPIFLVAIFCNGIAFDKGALPILLGVLKYLGLVVVVVLIRNTAPRLRIDQAVKFFWGPVTLAALVAVIAAFLGW
ncbi:MAG: NADH-quinone oxidoreductase subunit H [Kiritimatiellaeota bacterium]|nr:NADH-quinone oxidoreductase subunit H [Kiritimatiellota bacterium]